MSRVVDENLVFEYLNLLYTSGNRKTFLGLKGSIELKFNLCGAVARQLLWVWLKDNPTVTLDNR